MKGNYWTEDTDEAIWEYIDLIQDENDIEANKQKDILFNKRLYKPLVTLIESLINTYKLNNMKGTELDSEWLKSSCFLKLFEVLRKGYLKREKGRPFNYITSILRFHMIEIRKDNQKLKHYVESNFFDNEEFIYNEMMDEIIEYELNNNLIIDPDEVEELNISTCQYEKIIKYLEEDVKNKNFSSKKELVFAEQLYEVMTKIQKINYSNKFIIKFILSQLCESSGYEMKRFTINYYLLKLYMRYKKQMEKEC